MKRLFPLLLLTNLALVLLPAAESKRPTTLECDLEIVQLTHNPHTKQSITETQAQRIWIKDKMVRREERTVGGIEVLIEGAGRAYLFSPETKQGLKRKADKPILRPEFPEYFDAEGFRDWVRKNGAKKTGTEKLGGIECEVYTQSEGPATLRRWLRSDNGQLVKNLLIADAPNSPRISTSMAIKSMKVGGSIDDELFEAPRGITLKDVAELERLSKSAGPKAAKSTGKR